MRFLRLDFRDDLNSLDFHPLLTVVPTLEPNHQMQLLEAIRRLSSGSTVGLRGLVEHQGLMVELDASAGAPLAPIHTTAGVLVYVDGEAIRSQEIGLQAEIDQWERQAAIDAVAVEEIRSDLDLAVRAKAWSLQGTAAKQDEQSATAIASATKLRVAAIREAFEVVNSHEANVADCDPQILELIERWDRYSERRAESEEHLRKASSEVQEAEKELREKTKVLAEARKVAKPVLLTSEQESRLEALSDQSNDQSRLGKWKKTVSEEDEQERQELLKIVGVKSWTEYSVFRMSPSVSQDKQEALDEAEADLTVAEQILDRAKTRQARDTVATELSEELDRIKAEAEPFLGVLTPADIGAGLAEQIVQIDNPDWVAALNQLRDVLSSNDLHPPYGFEPSEILGWTEAWLRAEGSLDPVEEKDDGPEEDPKVAEAERQAALAIVNRALGKHNRALAQIGNAERSAVRSAMRVRELKNQLRVRSANPDATTAAEVLAIVAPVAEQVLKEVGGSVPIAVIGDMADVPDTQVEALMGAMEEVAQQVQVIMITTHQGVRQWTDRIGLERAGTANGTRALL